MYSKGLDFHPARFLEAIMMVSRWQGRFSSHLLKEALLKFYKKQRLYPTRMTSSWNALKPGP